MINIFDNSTLFPTPKHIIKEMFDFSGINLWSIKTILEPSCLDGNMEFFNGYEWKKIKDYNIEDEVLIFNKDMSAKMEFPIRFIKTKAGNMYEFKNTYLHYIVSEDHTMVNYDIRNNIETRTMKDLYERHNNDLKGFRKQFPTSFLLDGELEVDESILRLSVAVSADGRIRYSKRLNSYFCEIRVVKNRKHERLREILDKSKIEYKYKINNEGCHDYRFHLTYAFKKFPKEWYNLSLANKKVLLDELCYWDGSIYDNNYKRYSTTIEHNADFIQFIASSSGFTTNKYIDDRVRDNKNSEICYEIGYSTSIGKSMRNSRGRNKIEIHDSSSDGYQYCFTVSSGMFVVRSNDKIMVVGNCGLGNIVEYIRGESGNKAKHLDIDCIEIDKDAQSVLRGKGFKVIHDDFLTFNSFKKYSLIIMNPPFNQDEGCKHLLKALDIQKDGGHVVCILNAESIKNPYSNVRKDLATKLDRYDAKIKYIQNGFSNSSRKTDVEIAIIYVNIPGNRQDSIIVDYLKQEEKYNTEQKQANEIVGGDYTEQIIQQYNFEVQVGVRLIQEYESMKPYMSKDFDNENPILKLCLNDSNKYNDGNLINSYIEQIRYKYWITLFRSKQFSKLFTTDLRNKYMEKLDELKNYDFSLYNIEQIKLDMQLLLSKSLTDTIMDLFEDFTYKYSYTREFDNNIHYYNGWITNDCSKINDKKIILRLSGYDDYNGSFYPTKWGVKDKLIDIEKVFNYLDNGRTQFDSDIYEILKKAQEEGQTKRLEFKYFYCTMYKKGTCHIEWKDKDLIQKFNIYAAINKNNLPPSYGKTIYSNMTQKEKDVIDSFQGKDEYNKIMQDKNFYLSGTSNMLAIHGSN